MKEAGDLMSEQSQHIHFENTNRWSTKQLVTMALMCALGALFMYCAAAHPSFGAVFDV